MKNNQLALHINSMLNEYNQTQSFSNESLDQLLNLADYTTFEVSKLINKFHYINTQIADNGGIPVLKAILKELSTLEGVYIQGEEVERFGSVYLVERVYQLTDEYMKQHELYNKNRVTLVKIKGENGMDRMDFAI